MLAALEFKSSKSNSHLKLKRSWWTFRFQINRQFKQLSYLRKNQQLKTSKSTRQPPKQSSRRTKQMLPLMPWPLQVKSMLKFKIRPSEIRLMRTNSSVISPNSKLPIISWTISTILTFLTLKMLQFQSELEMLSSTF